MIYTHDSKFPTDTGIYKIWFEHNPDKIYVGSALGYKGKYLSQKGFRFRWRIHLCDLKSNKHHSVKLQNSYNKYKIDEIRFEIIEMCHPEIGLIREQYWIDFYDSYKKGLNSKQNATTMLGFRHSEDTRKSMSETHNRKFNEVYEDKIVKLYNDGFTQNKISILLNINEHSIKKVLKLNNIQIKKQQDFIRYTKNGTIIPKIFYSYDLNGNFITIESGIISTARKYNITASSIRANLNCKTKKLKNYFFSYYKLNKNKVLDIINIPRKKYKLSDEIKMKMSLSRKGKEKYDKRIKNIKQFSLNNELIKIWGDSIEVKNYLNIKNFSPIGRVIKNKTYKYRGFIWKLN